MKRRGTWIRWTWFVVNVAGIGGVHWWLQHQLAAHDVVAVLLSAGPHTPPDLVLQALAFVVVRVLAVVYLPYMVCNTLGQLAWEWASKRRRQSPERQLAEG